MMSQAELDTLAAMLRSAIAHLVGEPEGDLGISISLQPVDEKDPQGPEIMQFEIKVRGQDLSLDQEKLVAQFFRPARG